MSTHTPIPWRYRPKRHDDWGWIRGAQQDDGISPLVATVRSGLGESVEMLDEHRRNKTDPYEANSIFIVKAVNNHEKLLSALRDILSANKEFREGMPDKWDGDPLQDACEAAEVVMREAIA